MGVPVPKFELELEDAPNWISHIEVSQRDEMVVFTVIKTSGHSYGEARVSLIDFNNMADVLTTIRRQ
jgi:hypothetical protein